MMRPIGFKKLSQIQKSFTLLELLIVIGIIAVLVAVAVVAINPGRQFAKANNVRRTHDLKQIVSAIQQNMIDNRGPFFCAAGDIPACGADGSGTIMGSGAGQYNICDCLVPTYLPVMPVDPQYGSYTDCTNYDTQYEICSASLKLRAPHTQIISGIQDEVLTLILPGEITVKTPPTFSLSANPTSASIQAGQSTSTTITATSLEGFNQLVTFSTSISPAEPTISLAFSLDNACTPTCSRDLNISTTSTTPVGDYSITITGTDGGFTKQTTFTLSVTPPPPDFTLSANPTTIKAPQTGTSQTSTITIESLYGFNSAVTLSVSSGLPVGATANFNPNPVTPPPNGTVTSNFTVTTSNVTAGSYNLTIQGQSGAITKTTNVTLEVVDLSVSLTANPSSGDAPLNGVDLTATVSGTATGTINYKFDCNVTGSPGSLVPSGGTWDYEFNNILDNPKTVIDACNYSTAGTFQAGVRVERDVANPAEATTTINVTQPPVPIWASSTCQAGVGTPSGPAAYDYSMGYKFTPQVNGQVRSLCGFFQGTKWVRIYNSTYSVLVSAQVTGNAPTGWACTSITPLNVTAGSVYYVIAEIASSGGYYQSLAGLPKTCNNVTVNASAYQSPSGTFNASHAEITTIMYGMADIMFAY